MNEADPPTTAATQVEKGKGGAGGWKPLCTNCAFPASHVYTTYTSRSNIRLGVCAQCSAFIDPLIEAPQLLLLLDLVLLKPRVFLHLLFNRGSPPLHAADAKTASAGEASRAEEGGREGAKERQDAVHSYLVRLFSLTVLAEVVVRLASGSFSNLNVLLTTTRVLAELLAQLGVSTLLALIILRIRGWWTPAKWGLYEPSVPRPSPISDRHQDGRQLAFLPALLPLVLLYTTLLPLLLQLGLSIWSNASYHPHPAATSEPLSLAELAPAFVPRAVTEHFESVWNGSNKIWLGTKLLGGMSAGFGLRVLLPTRPVETTSIVLAGWGAAMGLSSLWDAVPL